MAQTSKNPFNLSFGRIPPEYIARHMETDFVVNTFTQLPVTDQTYLITGVRGCGKTVTMTTIGQQIHELDNWLLVKISPMEDILDSLLSTLLQYPFIHQWCIEAKIEVSLPAIHLSLETQRPAVSPVNSIDQILRLLQQHQRNLLIMIDEISNTPQMQAFSSALQLFITNNRPVFFVGTCVYEELESLRNVRNLTFLYRAPRISLAPLSLSAIAVNYQNVFHISQGQAMDMARFTKGYSYAFQVLGYYCWQYRDKHFPDPMIIDAFDVQLAQSSYDKLWSDLSENDKKVMRAIADNEGGKTKDLYTAIGMSSNNFNQYRARLKAHGLIDVGTYGKISFALPRFGEYIHRYTYD